MTSLSPARVCNVLEAFMRRELAAGMAQLAAAAPYSEEAGKALGDLAERADWFGEAMWADEGWLRREAAADELAKREAEQAKWRMLAAWGDVIGPIPGE